MARPRATKSALGALVLLALVFGSRRAKAKGKPVVRTWNDSDMKAFLAALEPVGIPLDASFAVYTAESGLDPSASSGIAWGLPQATAATLRGIGWKDPPAAFARLSVAQQAPWIARLQRAQIAAIGFVPKTPVDLYTANFCPKAAQDHSEVIYSRPSAEYAKNAALDTANKGWISRDDLALFVSRAQQTATYQHAVSHAKRLGAASLQGQLTA